MSVALAGVTPLPQPEPRYSLANEAAFRQIVEQNFLALANALAQVLQQRVEVTGDRSAGTALDDLLTKLEELGLITDSTVA